MPTGSGLRDSRSVLMSILDNGADLARESGLHPYIILLLLPLIGIAVFWLMPLPLAVLVYLLMLALSGVMYWITARAMKRHPSYGVEALIGAEARVVSRLGPNADAQYLVKIHGELWRANSGERLESGQLVTVLSVSGLIMTVRKPIEASER